MPFKNPIIYLIVLLFISCKKKETDTPCNGIPSGGGFFNNNTYTGRGFNFTMPFLNPNNPDEIAFSVDSGDRVRYNIKIFNKKTRKIRLLIPDYETVLLSRPSWGSNGWVLYGKGSSIYKINENGDPSSVSLILKTTIGKRWYSGPSWSPDCSKIVFTYESLANGFDSYTYMMNSDGTNLQFIDSATGENPTFSPDGNKIAIDRAKGFIIVDLLTGKRKSFEHLSPGDNGIQFCWMPNSNEIAWTKSMNNAGIFLTNITTGNTISLALDCKQRDYRWLCMDSANKSIITTRVDWKYIDDNTIYYETNIYRVGFDGKGETKLEIPF